MFHQPAFSTEPKPAAERTTLERRVGPRRPRAFGRARVARHEAAGRLSFRRPDSFEGSNALVLALDDVVDFDDLWRARELNAALGEDRHQTFTKRLEPLL